MLNTPDIVLSENYLLRCFFLIYGLLIELLPKMSFMFHTLFLVDFDEAKNRK